MPGENQVKNQVNDCKKGTAEMTIFKPFLTYVKHVMEQSI